MKAGMPGSYHAFSYFDGLNEELVLFSKNNF